jgi:hypothetical protein
MKVQLGLKQIPVGIKSIELSVYAALVSHVRQPLPILEHSDKRFLLYSGFSHSLVSDQCVGHFGERRLNRFLILHYGAFPPGFR